MTTTKTPFDTWLSQLRPLWQAHFKARFDHEPHALLVTAQDAYNAHITPAQFLAAAIAVANAKRNPPKPITY
jgi:hypothetical protein